MGMPFDLAEKYSREVPIDSLTQGNQLAQTLAEFLRARGQVPKVRQGYMPPNLLGSYYPGQDTVVFNQIPADSTVTHELGHKVDHVLASQAGKRDLGWFPKPPTQFEQAYAKLVYDPLAPAGERSGRQKLVEALIHSQKTGQDAFNSYRLSPDEVLGHGIGNQSAPNYERRFPNNNFILSEHPHLDATAATELMVLMELAKREHKP